MNEYSKKYSAALIGLGRIGFSLGFDRKREQPASHTMALKTVEEFGLLPGAIQTAAGVLNGINL